METNVTFASSSDTSNTSSRNHFANADSSDTMTSSLYSVPANQAIDRLSDLQTAKEPINYCSRIRTRTGKGLCADGVFRDLESEKQGQKTRLLSTESFSWTYNLQRAGLAYPDCYYERMGKLDQGRPSSPAVLKGQVVGTKASREVNAGALKRPPSLARKLSNAARDMFRGDSLRAQKKSMAGESYESLRQRMIEQACWEREQAAPRKISPEVGTAPAHDSAVHLACEGRKASKDEITDIPDSSINPNAIEVVGGQYPYPELVPQPLRISEQHRQAFVPISVPSPRLSSRKRVDISRKSWMPPDHGRGRVEAAAPKTRNRVKCARGRSSGGIFVLAEQTLRETGSYGGRYF